MNYNSLFASPMGRTSKGPFIGALVVLLLATGFYWYFVKGLNGEWVLFTLLFPTFMLHAGRLHDMGQSAALSMVPLGLLGVAFWPRTGAAPSYDSWLIPVSLVVYAAFAVWCCLAKGQDGANRFGDAPAA
jgi:uncharacterized membrane protein YhaH (DUF805 family)